MQLDLTTRLEALLFAEGGGPLARKRLADMLECSADELEVAACELSERRTGTGIAVLATADDIALAIAPTATDIIEKAYARELGRDIGDAGLEVLSIILYRGASTRSQIDYIRGVNTSSTIRNLSARGLIERIPNPADQREYLYRPTIELLAHLGITAAQELPDYAKIKDELAAFEEKTGPFDEHAAGNPGDITLDTDTESEARE